MAGSFKFEIEKTFGTLSTSPTTGMTKELNLVSFNGRPAKYDIRGWDEDHEKMSKGVTLTTEELIELREILNKMDIK